jgi:UTP--glucose-1-phosphate uridylyltransferase
MPRGSLVCSCRCPPGHGDIYPSLLGSGMLEKLLAKGIKYLFVSNSDNLGATMSLQALAHFAHSGKAFLMEVSWSFCKCCVHAMATNRISRKYCVRTSRIFCKCCVHAGCFASTVLICWQLAGSCRLGELRMWCTNVAVGLSWLSGSGFICGKCC